MSEEKQESTAKETKSEPKTKGSCLKTITLLFMFMIAAGVICFLGFCYITGKEAKATVLEMFDRYRPQKVAQSFFEYRDLQVQGNDGNILEVATGEQSVILSREDSVQILGKVVPMVKTTSSINVPATFRYHIDLNGKWKVIADDKNRLHVTAPPLSPSLPIAFDSSKLQRENPGWTKYITGSNMPQLEKTITPELEKKAKDPAHIKEFQAKAKESIAKFLQTWLVRDGQWADGKIEKIIVYFPGDEVDLNDQLVKPAMSIDQSF